jgi:cytochrome c oxidase assembly factor CtaG
MALLGLSASTRLGFAHEASATASHTFANEWNWDPLILLGLLLWAAIYGAGLFQLRSRPKAFPMKGAIAFALGWLTLFAALISPLHEWGESLFSAHMVQHELLMAVAAPLLVVGRPDLMLIRALPAAWRMELARILHTAAVHALSKSVLSPLVAWMLHAIALWTWHIPGLFDATISHWWVHALQHISFLGTALLFWGTLLYGCSKRAYGGSILYVFTTAIHTSILGALLTFASRPWYPVYANSTSRWGISALEDQQIGGLIMWVPAGIVYIIVGLWLFAGWIRDSDRRSSVSPVRAVT